MRTVILAGAAMLALSGCSSTPRPLVPNTTQGPTSYVCYSSMISAPEDVRSVAERQCGNLGFGVAGLIGQQWTPLRCGVLTPTVAAFQCGSGGMMAPLPPLDLPK